MCADRDLALMATAPDPFTHVILRGALQGFARVSSAKHLSRPCLRCSLQVDTSTAFASALAAFYEHIPVGLEAGLRTDNCSIPSPERRPTAA